MGNNNETGSFLQKDEGLRIISIKLNSPFDGKVEPFFDFIVDVVPLEQVKSSLQQEIKPRKKGFAQMMEENEDKNVEIKVVSTKYRNVRSIMVTPNRNWNGSKDMLGISVRKQKFDQVFDTYFPISDISINSPVQLAGIKEGEYLLGCVEFPYVTLDKFIEGLYDRFFDKEVQDKHVHLALYDLLTDEVLIKRVLLKRGWGGNGLLGCQFLQGQLYKFPLNLKQRRQTLLAKQQVQRQKQKLRNDLGECSGVSKALVQNLKNKQSKKNKHMQAIKNMISIPVPQIPQPSRMRRENEMEQQNNQNINQNILIYQQNVRIESLERRAAFLEETLANIRQYIDIIASQEESAQKKEQVNNLGQGETQTRQEKSTRVTSTVLDFTKKQVRC